MWSSSVLILSLLHVPVQPLTCYACSSSATNDECNKSIQDCPAPLNTCMTTVDTLGFMYVIVKHCASRATCNGAASAASVDLHGNGNQVECCYYNMCNYNDGESLRVSGVLVLLVACVCVLLPR